MNKAIASALVAAVLAGCRPVPTTATPAPQAAAQGPSATPSPAAVWVAPSTPDELRNVILGAGLPVVEEPSAGSLRLEPSSATSAAGTIWVYALVAPFPTTLDGVTDQQLRSVWNGEATESFGQWPLWMTEATREALSSLWGPPRTSIQIASAPGLLDAAWANRPSWAVIPFERIEPRWKVLTVDGESPVRKDFDVSSYSLKVRFVLSGDPDLASRLRLPLSNRDASKLTTVIMSGTSALVREIAYQMEVHGIDYPGRDIGDVLRQADILHVSHETSFDPTCPVPNPYRNRFFCSDPKYIGLFDDVGVDVVELTGNHILDNGTASMLYTLQLYRDHNIRYFGGGANLAEARQPLLIEDHGNRIAFVGCNAGEPPQPLAEATVPGANPCDWKQLEQQIGKLRDGGYLPIVTFQYKEGYSPMVMPWQSVDFRRAADAGAVIVSGSQSHVPLEMEFHNGTFIHYGLGNLFFGQMGNHPPGPGLPLQPAERYEFADRHVFYDGRYISTELLTFLLEDYARPRPMTASERDAILRAYFAYSGWLPLIPTPAPEQTPTLYPLLTFVPLPTHTPLPDGTPTP